MARTFQMAGILASGARAVMARRQCRFCDWYLNDPGEPRRGFCTNGDAADLEPAPELAETFRYWGWPVGPCGFCGEWTPAAWVVAQCGGTMPEEAGGRG